MAQLPPQLIHVKRKRTEDGPVEFLRIEQIAKRHRKEGSNDDFFLYRRAKTDLEAGVSRDTDAGQANREVTSPKRPVIHSSKPGDERRPIASLRTPKKDAKPPSIPGPSDASTTLPAPAPALTKTLPTVPEEESALRKLPPTIPSEPRRFHLSRKPSTLGLSRVSKRQYSRNAPISAVFVERNNVPRSTKAQKTGQLDPHYASAVAAEIAKSQQSSSSMQNGGLGTDAMDMDIKEEAREVEKAMPKRPGTKRIAASSTTPTPTKLPDSMMNRWDADDEQITRDMDEFTMQQIGFKIAEMKKSELDPHPRTTRPSPAPNTTPSKPMKFKPNVNVKRYHERHPEQAAALAASQARDTEMADVEIPENDDDYVTETYERILSDTAVDVPRDQMGLLVLEGEPDIDFFYGEEESDSDQEYEDDEDENAENYYAADYPDDEVASDDEFDRDPWSYRNDRDEYENGGSDDDEDEPGWSKYDSTRDSTRFNLASIDSGRLRGSYR